MRTNAHPLPALAAALFLAASAAAVSGCSNQKPDGAPPVVRGPNNVVVIVVYDQAHKQTWWSSQGLPDKLVRLSETNQDTVSWFSPNGEIHIARWAPKSPFDNDPVPDPSLKNVLKSGHLSPGSAKEGGLKCKDNEGKERQCYDYMVELELPDAEHTRVKIDPRIEVVP